MGIASTREAVVTVALIIAGCFAWCHSCSRLTEDAEKSVLLRQEGYDRVFKNDACIWEKKDKTK